MTKVFTPEILLQYIYKETEPELTNSIKQALLTDDELRDTYQNLLAGIQILDIAQQNEANTINYLQKVVI